MSIQTVSLAKKYAKAYLNLFGHELNDTVSEHIEQFAQFLDERRVALVFLGLPHISAEKKVQVVERIVDKFKLPENFKRLVRLLISSNRQMLIVQVLEQILVLYRMQHHIKQFAVESACPLDAAEKKEIVLFLEQRIAGTIRCNFVIDKDIIAGLRAQSDTLLWEYSVAKDIRNIKKSVNR